MDIDDIILNSIGGIIGMGLYRLLILFFKDEERVNKIIIAIGGCVAILTLMWEIVSYAM